MSAPKLTATNFDLLLYASEPRMPEGMEKTYLGLWTGTETDPAETVRPHVTINSQELGLGRHDCGYQAATIQ